MTQIFMMMNDLILSFPDHLEQSLKAADSAAASWKFPARRFESIAITGLGGSGIGGSMVADWISKTAAIPVSVNKNYDLPAFVGRNTLVLACSYSGNTEETLEAARQAAASGAEVAVLSSGGALLELALKNGWNALELPGGNPPRSMLGWNLGGLMRMLDFYEVELPNYRHSFSDAIGRMRENKDLIRKDAAEAARILAGHCTVFYATEGMAGLAMRIRQQINENGKMLGWSAAIPEMNHNELVGWAGGDERYAVVFMRHTEEHTRNAYRAELNKSLIEKKTPTVLEWRSEGVDLISQSLGMSHFADWVSLELSEINGVDILDIKVIDELKDRLSKRPS